MSAKGRGHSEFSSSEGLAPWAPVDLHPDLYGFPHNSSRERQGLSCSVGGQVLGSLKDPSPLSRNLGVVICIMCKGVPLLGVLP